MEFKDVLSRLRHEKGYTQKEVAKLLGYGSTAISNYECGRTEPSIQELKKMSFLFQVSIDYLVGQSKVKNYNSNTKDEQFRVVYEMFSNLKAEDKNTAELILKCMCEKD